MFDRNLRECLTFDDVMLAPGYSDVVPADVDVRTRLTRRGMGASNPIPDGHVMPVDPIAAIRAGLYLRVPVLAGKTRDETKLFPQLLALRPDLGGTSGRLLDDAAVFALLHRYDPEAAPQTRIEHHVPVRLREWS